MKNTLYLGLDPTRFEGEVTHYPIIEVIEKPELEPYFDKLAAFEHVIFTSQTAVKIFHRYAACSRPCITVGQATAALASSLGIKVEAVAHLEQAEGVLELLREMDSSYFFPHSAKARPLLLDFLKTKRALFFEAYDVVPTKKRIAIEKFDRFVFTSPSTVDAFLQIYGALPKGEWIAIGPITKKRLSKEKFQVK